MRPARAGWLLVVAAAALPGAAAAQSYRPQPQYYLLTTDVIDARALWVQPAGLVKRRESSISLTATADRMEGPLLLSQYGATLASGALAFGWQHDEAGRTAPVPVEAKLDTWVAGAGLGGARGSLGGAYRWHRGTNTKQTAFDVGGRYRPGSLLELSVVWRDVGSPVILGDTIRTTLVPGAAVQLFKAHVQLGADWELLTSNWSTSALRAGMTVVLPKRLAASLRWETTGDLDVSSFSATLTWNGAAARVAGFGAFGRGASPDHFGAWGAAVSNPTQPRRRFGGR